jgi:glycosyltransferase A (GT-A) superfamily protein (DUF2064 family)
VSAAVVVLAKAPVPGVAKTRLGRTVGDAAAADLAAAALLDTLDACCAVFPPGRRVVALAGELGPACRSRQLRAALAGWQVTGQQPGSLGERILGALWETHGLTGGPVVLLGMDTPHLEPRVLTDVVATVMTTGRPVLGPALDGGWWVLATADPAQAKGIAAVAMSRADTFAATWHAVCRAAGPPATAPVMRDVDTADDAAWVASEAPRTRFARAWAGHGHQPFGEPPQVATEPVASAQTVGVP